MAASKDARSAAAKKRASARAAGRTRTTMATPGKVQEAGVTAASVTKIVQQVIKQMGKSPAKPKSSTKPKATKKTQTSQSTAKAKKDAEDWVNLTGKYSMPKKPPARKRDTATWESTQKAKDVREAAKAYEKKEAAAARRKAAQQRNAGSGTIGNPRSQRMIDKNGNWGWR